jgi:phosphomannomutase
MNRVGHAFIKQRMRQEGRHLRRRSDRPLLLPRLLLRGQRLHPGTADPRADVEEEQSLHDLLAPYRERYFIPGEINTKLRSMSDVPEKLKAIEARYKDAESRAWMVCPWTTRLAFNVAASNTEPLLRLNLEAATPEQMEKRRDEVLQVIRG